MKKYITRKWFNEILTISTNNCDFNHKKTIIICDNSVIYNFLFNEYVC